MTIDMALRGSLASLPDSFNEMGFLCALAVHGLTLQDSRLLIEKAVLEGYVAHAEHGLLTKLPRAFERADAHTAAADGKSERESR